MKRPDATDPKSFRYKFRFKRFKKIEVIIREILETQSVVKILDVGGRRDYWDYLSEELRPKVFITVINYEGELTEFEEKADNINLETVIGDGCNMPQYADNSFDLVHSNSVIEHVGSLENMGKYAAEIRRIGKRYYVQAPNLWFPIDPHFGVPIFHWLPDPTRAVIMHKYKVGFSDTPIEDYVESLSEADSIKLVDKSMMKRLFPECKFQNEKFMLLTKSIVATY